MGITGIRRRTSPVAAAAMVVLAGCGGAIETNPGGAAGVPGAPASGRGGGGAGGAGAGSAAAGAGAAAGKGGSAGVASGAPGGAPGSSAGGGAGGTVAGARDAGSLDARPPDAVASAPAPDASAADVAPAAGTSPSDELYDPRNLPRFDLEIPPDSIAALNKDGRVYARATLKYGAETVADIGVHLKGEASFRTLAKKAAFKLKFDEFVPDRTFRGLKRMTWNNMMEDPSFIAERLSYLVFRTASLPAPRANSALVYVNGAYYGVYTNIETEDKTFLRRWFASNDGNLYEENGKDFTAGNEASFQLETNEEKNDRSDLKAFIAAIAAAKDATYLQDLDATLDTAHYLKFSVAEALVNQWDMYSYTYYWPNNFRIYNDPATKKFTFLPWGMDMTMKPREGRLEPHILLFMPAGPAGVVFKRCLRSAPCQAAYRKVVPDILKLFESLDLPRLAALYYAQVKDHVYRDTRKEVTNPGFETAYQSVLKTIRDKPAIIRAQLGM